MKIITVLGTRPQFIKASVVSGALSRLPGIVEDVIHTGQHFDTNMSDVFFEELGMFPPRYRLNIHGGRHGEMTGRMLAGVEDILIAERPDAVLVYGDTNSTLAGALAAVKLHVPVAHVEAGLRSFNKAMPEEVNRILTDRVSRWLFAPTKVAVGHLQREGTDPLAILNVGDVMYDVALHFARMVEDRSPLCALGLETDQYVLATVHRAENTDDPRRLKTIVDGLSTVAERHRVVWPVHPRTQSMLKQMEPVRASSGLLLIDPVGYLDMVWLEKHASVIATDSGGVQKEAFFHRVPCVTLRDETEWTELVEAGWNRLASPSEAQTIARSILEAHGRYGDDISPYGTGNAAEKIADRLWNDLGPKN